MTSRGKKTTIGELPVTQTEIITKFSTFDGRDLTLRFEFYRGEVLMSGGLVFRTVRAIRYRAESHCTGWHVEGAYDTILEVEDSPWVEELLMAEPAETWGRWVIRHFMLYVESSWEVAAQSWEMLPVEPVA